MYLLVILTTLAAFGYFSMTLKKLERCLRVYRGVFRLHITGIFIVGVSLTLWRVIHIISVPAYVFQTGALVGGLLYALPMVKSRAFRAGKELSAQIAAVFLTVFVFSLYTRDTSELWLWGFMIFFQSIMLLVIEWLLSVKMLTRFEKRSLRTASWLVVLFAWLRSYQLTQNSICLFYIALMVIFISSVLLLYSAIVFYERASRWL